MGRYFLHLEKREDDTLIDQEGYDFANLEDAQSEANAAARELLAAVILSGREADTVAVVLVDELGLELYRAPLIAALPKNLR